MVIAHYIGLSTDQIDDSLKPVFNELIAHYIGLSTIWDEGHIKVLFELIAHYIGLSTITTNTKMVSAHTYRPLYRAVYNNDAERI